MLVILLNIKEKSIIESSHSKYIGLSNDSTYTNLFTNKKGISSYKTLDGIGPVYISLKIWLYPS